MYALDEHAGSQARSGPGFLTAPPPLPSSKPAPLAGLPAWVIVLAALSGLLKALVLTCIIVLPALAWFRPAASGPAAKPRPASPEPKDWPAGLTAPLVNSVGMKFASIPAGQFLRGAHPEHEDNLWNARPRREISISAFHMGIFEVTQAEYERVMGNNPSLSKRANNPVEGITHDEAVEFCRRLSELPAEKAAGRVYRLPTEAEWEYACRAGTPSQKFNVGAVLTRADANISEGGLTGGAREVGSYRPNAWGLCDMHGNVAEWCSDWYEFGYYATSPADNPRGPDFGSQRVYRGGSWGNTSAACLSACRSYAAPGWNSLMGFRVVLVSPAR